MPVYIIDDLLCSFKLNPKDCSANGENYKNYLNIMSKING